jgi:ATP-binding cassette subfamily B protein
MEYILRYIFLPFLLKNKTKFCSYFFFVILTLSISSILIPIFLSKIIDISKQNKSFKTTLFLYFIAIIVIYIMVNHIKNIIQNKLLINTCSEVKLKTLNIIVENLTKSLNTKTESEITNYSNMIYWGTRIFIKYIFENFLPYLIINCIVLFYFLSKNYISIFVILLVQFLIILTIIKINYSKQIKLGNDIENNWVYASNILGDKIQNLENIFINNSLKKELKEINQSQFKLDNTSRKYYDSSNIIDLKLNFILYLFFIILLFFIINNRNNIKISLIIFIILIYNTNLTNFIKETVFIFHNLSKIITVNSYIKDIYDKNITNTTLQNKKRNIKYIKIKFKNISFKYKENGNYIIKNLNIDFLPNKINLLIGKSGSGKTTIVKLIIKKYKCTSGKILCDNYNLDDLSIKTVFNNVYYVNQKTNLFNESIINNINYGNHNSHTKIKYLLKKYDLYSVFEGVNYNLNYNCGINGSNLSLGMQKVIIVLRGILNNNKNIIIFDEPATSLDKNTTNKIVNLIISETKNKTVIIITHGTEFNKYAHNIIKL